MEQQQTVTMTYTQQLRARLHLLIFVKDIEAAELVLCGFTFWWGLMLTINNAQVKALPFYRLVTNQLPAFLWASIYYGTSALMFIGVTSGNIRLRKIVIAWTMFVWAFTSYILVTGGEFSTWSGPAVILLVAAAWTYWRLAFVKSILQ